MEPRTVMTTSFVVILVLLAPLLPGQELGGSEALSIVASTIKKLRFDKIQRLEIAKALP